MYPGMIAPLLPTSYVDKECDDPSFHYNDAQVTLHSWHMQNVHAYSKYAHDPNLDNIKTSFTVCPFTLTAYTDPSKYYFKQEYLDELLHNPEVQGVAAEKLLTQFHTKKLLTRALLKIKQKYADSNQSEVLREAATAYAKGLPTTEADHLLVTLGFKDAPIPAPDAHTHLHSLFQQWLYYDNNSNNINMRTATVTGEAAQRLLYAYPLTDSDKISINQNVYIHEVKKVNLNEGIEFVDLERAYNQVLKNGPMILLELLGVGSEILYIKEIDLSVSPDPMIDYYKAPDFVPGKRKEVTIFNIKAAAGRHYSVMVCDTIRKQVICYLDDPSAYNNDEIKLMQKVLVNYVRFNYECAAPEIPTVQANYPHKTYTRMLLVAFVLFTTHMSLTKEKVITALLTGVLDEGNGQYFLDKFACYLYKQLVVAQLFNYTLLYILLYRILIILLKKKILKPEVFTLLYAFIFLDVILIYSLWKQTKSTILYMHNILFIRHRLKLLILLPLHHLPHLQDCQVHLDLHLLLSLHLIHPLAHPLAHPLTHLLAHPLVHPLVHPLAHPLVHPLAHPPVHRTHLQLHLLLLLMLDVNVQLL